MAGTLSKAVLAAASAATLAISTAPAAGAQESLAALPGYALGSVAGSADGISVAFGLPGGSLAPGTCVGFDPAGFQAFRVNSYLVEDGARGIYVVAGPAGGSRVDFTIDIHNTTTGERRTERGTVHGDATFGAEGAAWIDRPLTPGHYEWTVRDMWLHSVGPLGPGPYPVRGCSGTWQVG